MKIKRDCFNSLLNQADKPYISVLIGPRQVGKSFLLEELDIAFRKKKKSTVFYNLEFPDDLMAFSQPEPDIIKMLVDGPDIIFIDEFHYLKNATKIFKSVYDKKAGKKIFVSGSSSIEMHKHLKESLAGRFRVTHIGPLSLAEQMSRKKYDSNEYLVMGGLPGLLHEKTFDDKTALLKNIVQTYLLKDIKGLIKEENIRTFNHLLYHIAQNQGAVSTVAGFAREVRLSEPAVNHHLDIMEQTRVVFGLMSYSANLSNEIKKSRKYYLYDLGIRNSILNDFSQISQRSDRGELLESFVFLAMNNSLKPNMELRFWRTRKGDEVDFIVLKNRVPYPVEVKYSLVRCEVPPGMKKFMSVYKNVPEGFVVSMDFNGTTKFEDRTVNFVSWKNLGELELFRN